MNTKERLYGDADFSLLCNEATKNARLRCHRNLHTSFSDPCQRLFIAMQMHSYVVPHRHTSPAKSETLIALRGCIGLVFFDDQGEIVHSAKLGPGQPFQVCDIPAGVWHTAIALEPNCVFMEAKPGPYSPIEPTDIPAWAPPYETAGIEEYMDTLYAHFKQDDILAS